MKNFESVEVGDWVGLDEGRDIFSKCYYPLYVMSKNIDKGLYVCEVFTGSLSDRKRWIKSWDIVFNKKDQKMLNDKLIESGIKDKDLYLKKYKIDFENDPWGEETYY